MGLISPLLYILLFSPLLKNLSNPPLNTGEVLDSFVPGILTLLAFIGGNGAGYGVIFELQNGVIERLRVTPASRFSLLMGTVLRDITAYLVPSVLVIIISGLFGFKIHIAGLFVMFLLLILLTAIVSVWSGSIGLILKQTSSMAAIVAGMELPVTLLSGVLLPLSLGPKWLRAIAHINPLYYVVEASRVLSTGVIGSPAVLKAFAVIIPLTVITLIWSTGIYRKAIS